MGWVKGGWRRRAAGQWVSLPLLQVIGASNLAKAGEALPSLAGSLGLAWFTGAGCLAVRPSRPRLSPASPLPVSVLGWLCEHPSDPSGIPGKACPGIALFSSSCSVTFRCCTHGCSAWFFGWPKETVTVTV